MTTKLPIRVLVDDVFFPEGPAFQKDGTLWAVELHGQCLIEYKDDTLKRCHVGGGPNGIAIDRKGNIYFCDSRNNSIRRFVLNVGIVEDVITNMMDGNSLNMPNDLAFDWLGNLIFSCPGDSRKNPTGYVCAYNPATNVIKVIADGMYFPNGIAFTPDGKYLVVAETYRHKLWKGEWNAYTSEWSNRVEWCDIGGPNGPGGPDGMAFDVNGNLYVAVYGTGRIKMVDVKGVVKSEIPLPGLNPTNCAFDPTGKLGLVVCEAQSSAVLSIDIGIAGATLFS